ERGFEIVLPRAARDVVWTALARHARPAGFAAADILRIEAGFLLFANELRFPVSAAELELGRFAADASAACRHHAAERERRVRLLCFQASCDSEPLLWQPPRDAPFPPAPRRLFTTSACPRRVTSGAFGFGYPLAP